jgi:hypothetical protein
VIIILFNFNKKINFCILSVLFFLLWLRFLGPDLRSDNFPFVSCARGSCLPRPDFLCSISFLRTRSARPDFSLVALVFLSAVGAVPHNRARSWIPQLKSRLRARSADLATVARSSYFRIGFHSLFLVSAATA